MSKRWPGGIVTKTQATPTGPYQDSSAPGIWTLNQMSYWVKQALWPTVGNTNPNAFIENLFSTWLYTGNGSTQTITNGLNLSGQGGLTWVKSRSDSTNNFLFDTSRGALNEINSNTTEAQASLAASLTAFNTNGFNLGAAAGINVNATTYVSWTFREQPKFFDVVTYSGNAVPGREIAHSLGSAPGCIIVKNTNVARDWAVWHRSLADGTYLKLNTTDSVITNTSFQVFGNASGQTSSVFTVGKTGSGVNGLTNANALGETYVAYLFAHNAGGFGLTGTENVISCGSYTASGAGTVVNLGYEAQWVMVKSSTAVGGWYILDNMRSMGQTGLLGYLDAASTSAEPTFGSTPALTATATGFIDNGVFGTDGRTMIYIAIRRGPMAVPTLGTSVFSPITSTSALNTKLTTGFPIDLQWTAARASAGTYDVDRLRGVSTNTTASARVLLVPSTSAEAANTDAALNWDNTGFSVSSQWANQSIIYWNFRRAPGFFDVVCYTGTGAVRTVNHNLTVAPELMIIKQRTNAGNWFVYVSALGNTKQALLNLPDAATASVAWVNTSPTSTVFSLGSGAGFNGNTFAYVAYLFATVAGVSKVGSYTGTGATLNIDAGFTTGARFVMIKRTDSTGDWFVWDTARGMVAGTDPRIAINTVVAESNANWVYTTSAGFQIVTTDATVNASGGSYIYLAIA